jgi:acetyltransferase-like isoleucine patch superfamily enzyme
MIRQSNILRQAIHWLGNLLRAAHVLCLRLSGVRVGRNTMISLGAKIDTRRGKVIIGDNCLITHGVKILSHDGAMRLIDPTDDGSGTTRIGNNVFVGVNAVILRNITVGDNSVVAAGAIVTRDVPPGTVVAGNPAKVVKELQGPFQILNNPKHPRK